MGIGRIVIALFENPLHPEWGQTSKAEVRAAQRQEHQLTCTDCGLPGGTLTKLEDGKYRHMPGFCRKRKA